MFIYIYIYSNIYIYTECVCVCSLLLLFEAPQQVLGSLNSPTKLSKFPWIAKKC